MNHRPEEQQIEAVRPKTVGQWAIYLVALSIIGTIEFIEAIPYHLSFYAWAAWYYTGGQVRLLFMSWQFHLEQRRVRHENPSYRKLDR